MLREHLQAPPSLVARAGDVDYASLEAAVAARFSDESLEDVQTLVEWTVMWGYLR